MRFLAKMFATNDGVDFEPCGNRTLDHLTESLLDGVHAVFLQIGRYFPVHQKNPICVYKTFWYYPISFRPLAIR